MWILRRDETDEQKKKKKIEQAEQNVTKLGHAE